MARQIWLERLAWSLQIALAGVFFNAAYRKFTDHAVPVETFQALGMDPWFRYVTGCLELAGGIGLLIRPVSGLAALGLAIVMIGAIGTHLFLVPDSILPASLLLLALLLVATARKEEILEQGKLWL
jgi:putative oxidoreductase